ncbi:MAG TPA: hypothetical protein VEJ20_00305 [Candidatus Eremiobacteraceae bacterium]|nr:hypothetical protein [Candidatus Eremiobacteraceae bacterium]
MSPEMLNAVASIATFVVITITAVAALIQLRHMRAGNQLTAMMEYINHWQTKEMQRAITFVQAELPAKLRDPAYRGELFEQSVDRTIHLELTPADWCEQAGSFIKFGLMTEAQFLDLAGSSVEQMWDALKEVIAIRRVALDSLGMYENFEYLVTLEQRKKHQQGSAGGYPAGTARLLSMDEARRIAGADPHRAGKPSAGGGR